ncbi:MAG: UPF0175 family protein [Thermoplasmatota archaeon]
MDTVKTKIELPRSILNVCKTDEKMLSKTVTRSFIIELYRDGVISLRKVGGILGLKRIEMMAVLRERNIPLNYDSDELEKDREP